MKYPSFVENTEYYSGEDSDSRIQQIIELANNLRDLHQITTKNYRDFNELISEYLRVGIGMFKMKIGIVSNIVDNDYFICNAISPDDSISKGDVFELEGTYCREVYRTRKVLGFPHVGSMEEMKNHPVYENMKLESYISAPIYVHSKLFGTLNFSSTEARKKGFSENERELISIMASSIGNFLQLQQKEEKLVNSNDRLKRLVGYVAHDLRNPIGSVRKLAEFIETKDQESKEMLNMIQKESDKSLEMISTILDFAAIGTGKIDLKLTEFNFSKLFQEVAFQFKPMFSSRFVKLEVSCDENISIEGDRDRLRQVLQNLIGNSAKYTPDRGWSKISLRRIGDNCRFETYNSKEDLYKKFGVDKSVFESLNRSVGFGLEIVREVLELHNSKLYVIDSGSEFKVIFSI